MAEVRTIRVITNEEKPTGMVTQFIRQAMFWSFLVGAEGGSRMWFGGSWVVDVMIVALVITWMITMIVRSTQVEVRMTPSEIRRWVGAGMPLQVKEWRASEKTRLVS
jgi:hypothetical protein